MRLHLILWVGSVLIWLTSTLAGNLRQPIDVRHIQLEGEMGRRISITVRSNLLALDVDRDFLSFFREKTGKESYVGLGKLIDCTARFTGGTGDADLRKLHRRLVEEAIRTQEPDGYLGTFPPDRRTWTLWDMHEGSYLVLGLCTDYEFFQESGSLKAAVRLGDYLMRRWTTEPHRKPGDDQITVYMAVTGIENAMLRLHQLTGDRRYLEFVRDFRQLPEWPARITIGRWGQIEGHAYAYLCRCVAQLRLHQMAPDSRLLEPCRRVTDFMLRRNGMVISGAIGDHECWHDSQEGSINLGETCATAYLLRFWDERLRRDDLERYGDLMERSIYNALFAAQSPDGRRLRYYSPFESPREYFKGDTYCCPCNYRRIVAELPAFVAYRQDDGIAVNLYEASQATVSLGHEVTVRLRQQTRYPSDGRVVLEVSPSRATKFPLRLRIPAWCPSPSVTVNGTAWPKPARPGASLAIQRLWQAGDRVDLDLPMPWRLVKGRAAQAGRVAVMRGPSVFCLNRSRHPELANVDLRLLVLDPTSLTGPEPDTSVRPEGVACRVKAWKPGEWYPFAKPTLTLTLTEFADPGCEAAYFKVPDPNAPNLVDDELLK